MKIVAHRGNKRYCPENTMASFCSAVAYPIDGIEFDLQFTKDNIPVVIHDEKIDRTTNGRGYVRSFTLHELRQFDAGVWFHKRFIGEKIPTFEEVLIWSKGQNITLHVELKPQKQKVMERFLDVCLAMIEKHNKVESVIISTFSQAYLAYIKSKNPKIKTALLAKTPPFNAIKYASKIGVDAIHIRHTYQASHYYRRWMSKGLVVRAYNVHRHKDALKCNRLNIDSIITNDPKKMTEAFQKEEKTS
ncbi:glycerophosphodiester phosphodiesterase family protein [Evansella sp. AB-P1]|uniref:glycerophosphodiester phosphodiesterase n=1 Tax=Evansella sp. AB-P1 TaxID=3037653 RepID=UPI00241EE8BD|nr:glycerophosphodiester phosphodiesterase family protein [Evansella sp. AB-P1]MDG5786563.1 glycerophosphodiester phosphodiesterase family protein [Evansella sp. AB-P1]